MAKAYGACLIVLTVGFVLFVLMTSAMAFVHPERAKQFLELFVGPALTMLGVYVAKLFHEYQKQIQKID